MTLLKTIISALTLISLTSLQAAETPPEVKIGQQAQDFTLNNEDNKSISLSDYKGKNTILIFSRSHK